MEKKLFLVDAFALIFRAYYALIRNPRITSKGKNTNAQFGFTNALLDLLNNQKPTHLAVCFDTSAPTERHIAFQAYKAQRQEAPEDLLAAIPDIKKIIDGFNIPLLAVDGYEADDVIGTLAWKAHDAGYEVYMVTPDKDYGQLVRDGVYIYKPGYQGGVPEILGPAEVCAKWNISDVSQVVDVLGLMGDAVDNIPGIAGVGEKTAAKLLAEFQTLEKVLENADSIKGSLGEKIRNGREAAILSKKLATIITDVPVVFHEENFAVSEPDPAILSAIFTELEFKTLGKRVLGDSFQIGPVNPVVVQQNLFGEIVSVPSIPAASDAVLPAEKTDPLVPAEEFHTIQTVAHRYQLADSKIMYENIINTAQQYHEICFDTETTSIDANNAELVGMSFCFTPHEAWYVPLPADRNEALQILAYFKPLFADETKTWIGQNIKYDLLVLKWYNISLQGAVYDTMLAHYVIEPDGKRNMDALSEKYLHYTPVSIEELIGKKGKGQGTMRDVPLDQIKDYAAEDADVTLQLKHVLHPMLKENQVEKVFYEADLPLVKVLADMEYEGIRIDEAFLRDYSIELQKDAATAEERVYEKAGVRFNLASPKQLGEVLFDILKVDPKAKKTKTGQYATGEDVLAKLAQNNPIVDDILAFRELTKLKSTYVDALPALVNKKTGRVHTTYSQAVAVTGRLASNNPNLQNIPVRTSRGREIRKAFIPRNDDFILVSADYSQIELRIVAAISGDPCMCAAFRNNIDIHTATAAKVYGVSESEVTKEMRYKAKSVNFGIIYGQGAFGLAENLSISRTEAKEIIDNYKKEFAGITGYMEETVNFARKNGYVQTVLGRKRWLRDINSANFTVRGFAERNAVNSPIQGTAADMIKLAMISIHKEIQSRHLKSRMILQVHDELVFDAHKDELDILKPLVLDNMRAALILPNDVPVEAELGSGTNWLEAH
jgi:DNA polymerase-1